MKQCRGYFQKLNCDLNLVRQAPVRFNSEINVWVFWPIYFSVLFSFGNGPLHIHWTKWEMYLPEIH